MRRSECWSKPFEYPVEARQHYTSIGKIKNPAAVILPVCKNAV
ncbi:hypothetical protein M703_05705 [Neisseria gonorrhoeae SK29344]|uniref:Uncharacterized protein n=2 Tax=Neisseria gonorrhoeae TaxID=485 RepID=A0AA44U9M2_NEIGO|nr:Hypothetical protein NGK_1215 [Neisseria gonorrhoeae NCCP11945]APW53341.1 hypothetical protein T556_05555 [Neisseria gonorrhoeae NG-k51.05]EFE04129.1 conserved hypothetical protein [Neisseria gonorrhoeae DGI2]KLR77658.1 hypothetical protein M680_03195 [Neisseria gonorrhoeae SK8976]KLR78139.1 hypothetical protein M717_01690 [Neisseria gonorrhoeae SK33414]KLR82199.1 hypothetical protein M679_00820 [Neisseria gonorrhoeae SK7842]KLR83500.1 hypothetical protein M675_02710 [Neisseria gonorrhoeae